MWGMANAYPAHVLSIIAGPVAARPEERVYRKGNWTLQETIVLIAAKKLDDERRLKGGDNEKSKTTDFRWKWVENYCWKNGCHRSQNQCNDKWDNLLRDYKKVRDHEIRDQQELVSYWQMEKHERKDKGLPSGLLIQVYDALYDTIDRRFPPKVVPLGQPAPDSNPPPLSGPLPLCMHPPTAFPMSSDQSEDESQSDDSSPSVAKKRKFSESSEGLAPAMYKSTVELTQTLLACEDNEDRRHRALLGIEERKLHIEEAKSEISRQGMVGLISAVNNLATVILTLAADINMPET